MFYELNFNIKKEIFTEFMICPVDFKNVLHVFVSDNCTHIL